MEITLKALRIMKGWTQKTAAEAIGVSVTTLSNYELSKTFPSVSTIKKIEDVYGVGYNNIKFLIES